MEMTGGMTNDEPRIGDGISSDFSPSSKVKVPYSRLVSSTREPPRAPVVYDRLAKSVYVNTSIDVANDTSGIMCDEGETDSAISVSPSSEVGTSYSGLEPSTREPHRDPVAYDHLVKPVYVNTNTALANYEISGIINEEGETDSVISISPSSEVGTSYSGLEPSTREPPSAPLVYDRLVKPDYVNANTALANDEMNGIMCTEGETDSVISTSPSSEVGASYSGLESSTRGAPTAPVAYDILCKPISGMTHGTICDKQPHDSRISRRRPINTSTEMVTKL